MRPPPAVRIGVVVPENRVASILASRASYWERFAGDHEPAKGNQKRWPRGVS